MKTMFAATAMMLGTMAFGQSTVQVKIPFEFRTANATLPAGNYVLYNATVNWGRVMIVKNTASEKVSMVMAAAITYGRAGDPSLQFACKGSSCSLRAVRTSEVTLTYPLPHASSKEDGTYKMVSIPLVTRNGD